MRFQLCVADDAGWRYLDVELEVPRAVLEMESIIRLGLTLPGGGEGRVKKYWKEIAASLREQHSLGTSVWILRPFTRECS